MMIYIAVRQTPQSSDPIYDRESDFVEHQNVLYVTSADPDVSPVAYTDYSSIVPTITSATAKPRNYSGYSDSPMNENPYEDFTENVVSTGNPNASKSTAPPKPSVLAKKPTPPSKPSVPKKGAPHQLDSVEETDMNDIYSAVVKSDPTPKPQRVVEDEAMDEDAYGFPLQKAAPSIPDKNFSDGGDDGVKKQKPAPANKKGLRLKIGNNKANTDEARKSQNAYNNVAMAQNETNGDVAADNVYGNIDKQADNVYGNVGVNGKAKSKENSKGKSKNNSALVYCNVEFIPPKEGSSRSNSKRFKIADDSVTYSSIHVESASKDGK